MGLEIRFNRGRTFENESFRRIAKVLSEHFETKDIDGLLIGNAFVESNEFLRPDLLLYSPYGTLIIDLKDGGGDLVLPPQKDFERIPWSINNRIVKAGSDRNINPYVQLKRICSRYLKTLQDLKRKYPAVISSVLPENRETPEFLFYSSMVLFSGRIDNVQDLAIPYPVNRWFFIADEKTLLNKIQDISNNAKYSPELANVLKSVFKADPYSIDNTLVVEEYKSHIKIEFSPAQKECLEKIKKFLSQHEKRVLILRGKEKAGKSFLIPEISQLALECGSSQIETLTVTKRIANKLNRNSESQFTSIYSMIYGGAAISEINDDVSKEEDSINKDAEDDILESEIIPLRKISNDPSDSTLFIVDEAQLLNSSHFESENIQFGSGNLLDDFIGYISLDKSARKIIFIGDPYQLSYGKHETSALSTDHVASLIGTSPEVLQLTSDEELTSDIDKSVDFIAKRISEGNYNNLKIFKGTEIEEIQDDETRVNVIKALLAQKETVRVLCYKNETAFKLNEDLRSKIYGRTGDLAPGDLLVFDNNIRIISSDPHEMPVFLNNGSNVEMVRCEAPVSIEPITLKDKKTKIVLSFRRAHVKESNRDRTSEILILENYRLNPKGRLSSEEMVALKIYQGRIIKEQEIRMPFETSIYQKLLLADERYIELQNKPEKTKREEAELKRIVRKYKKAYRYEIRRDLLISNQYFNLAFVRYAYALTVHRSLGEYYPNVIFDVNMDRGKTNRDYFQWLYTGFTRAQKKLFVINFQNIHPLQGVVIRNFDASCISTSEPGKEVGIAYELIPASVEFKEKHETAGLSELVINNAFTIIKWMAQNGQEGSFEYNPASKYLVKIKSKDATIVYNFNAQGIPGIPRVEKGSNDFKLKFLSWITPKYNDSALKFPDNWRGAIYKAWCDMSDASGIKWNGFETHGWKDRIWLRSGNSFLVVDIDFNSDGFMTVIKPYKTSDQEIWSSFTKIVSEFCDING